MAVYESWKTVVTITGITSAALMSTMSSPFKDDRKIPKFAFNLYVSSIAAVVTSLGDIENFDVVIRWLHTYDVRFPLIAYLVVLLLGFGAFGAAGFKILLFIGTPKKANIASLGFVLLTGGIVWHLFMVETTQPQGRASTALPSDKFVPAAVASSSFHAFNNSKCKAEPIIRERSS